MVSAKVFLVSRRRIIKPLFAHIPSLNTRLLLALLASLALFFMDARLNYFSSVRSVLSTIVYPIQVIASLPSDLGDWTGDFFQDREQLREKNTAL